jgi:hypothetical protein
MKRFVRFVVPEKIPQPNALELKIKEVMLKPLLFIMSQKSAQFQ